MTALEFFVINHPLWAYAIVFAGMLIEGESFFLTASIFAAERELKFGVLTAVSLAGMLAGDWLYYLFGRYSKKTRFGAWVMNRFPRYDRWLGRNFTARYTRLAFLSKYIYFVNRLTPFLAGWHGFPQKTFLKIHFYAAVVWTGVMLILSHFLALLVELVGVKFVLQRIEFVFIGLLILFIGGEYIVKKLFAKRIEKNGENGAAA